MPQLQKFEIQITTLLTAAFTSSGTVLLNSEPLLNFTNVTPSKVSKTQLRFNKCHINLLIIKV